MYNLARSQYAQNGCKNYKVRPLIPPSFLTIVRNSNAIKMDPLFSSTWKVLKEVHYYVGKDCVYASDY